MKKIVSFLLAAVLCVGMTTSVFAAPSATYSPIAKPDNFVTTDFTGETGTPEEVIADKLGNTKVLNTYAFNIEPEAGEAFTEQWVTVTIGNALFGDTWKCYAYNEETHEWDEMEVRAGNGLVMIYFKHMCDVVLVQTAVGNGVVPTPSNPNGDVITPSTPSTSTTGTSPKTADAGMYIVILAAAALAGTVVVTRKVKANR